MKFLADGKDIMNKEQWVLISQIKSTLTKLSFTVHRMRIREIEPELWPFSPF